MKKKKLKIKLLKNVNKPILILTIIYMLLGAFLILDASSISSVLVYGNSTPYYYFKKQLLFIGIGLLGSAIILNVNTKWYKAISFLLSGFFILILAFVYFKNKLFSSGVNEVTLSLFGGRFQPAEFLKVLLVMYAGSKYGSWSNNTRHSKWSFIIPLVPAVVATLLIFLGGDYGSAAVMVALFALMFVSVPTKEKIMIHFKRAAVICLVFAVFFLKFAYLIIPDKVLESNYRLNRLIYTSPCDRYEENSGYQVCNGYIAIDNGGLTGVGIGDSVQKYLYLPASHTDFIFPIVVEELGSLVGVLIIIGYMAILFFIFKIATNTSKLQNSLICYGLGIYFMLHIFVNLGGVLGIIPLTGVPLPFLSYGGSFCIAMIFSFAIIQRINIENIEYKQKKLEK